MRLKDFLQSINYDKTPLLDGDEKFKELYPQYIVNRCLSFFPDTIFHANEMNCNWDLDKKMQFDFHRFSIRKKKRFSPWVTKQKQEDVELIKEIYGYTESKAIEALNILGPGDLETLKKSLDKGGTK